MILFMDETLSLSTREITLVTSLVVCIVITIILIGDKVITRKNSCEICGIPGKRARAWLFWESRGKNKVNLGLACPNCILSYVKNYGDIEVEPLEGGKSG